jgi:hypothetical protein
MGVHGGLTDRSVLRTDAHNFTDFGGCFGSVVGKVFYVDAGVGFFVEFETVARILGEKIANIFIVNLEVGSANQELRLV